MFAWMEKCKIMRDTEFDVIIGCCLELYSQNPPVGSALAIMWAYGKWGCHQIWQHHNLLGGMLWYRFLHDNRIIKSNVGKGEKRRLKRSTAASGIGPQLIWMSDAWNCILRLYVSGYGVQRMGKLKFTSSLMVHLSNFLELCYYCLDAYWRLSVLRFIEGVMYFGKLFRRHQNINKLSYFCLYCMPSIISKDLK